MKPINRAFGKKLRELRYKKKWTLSKMAAQCGMDSSNYQKIEYGEKDIRLSTLFRILTALESKMSIMSDKRRRTKR